MQTKFRFNKKTIDLLPIPEKRLRLRDTGVDGLVLELSPSGTKTFRVYKKIKGQSSPVTVTLGKYPALTIENSRKKAIEALSAISTGVNPNERQRAERLCNISLREVYEDYTKTKKLSASTRLSYRRNIETYLSSYQKKPLSRINEEDVKKEHRRISQASPAQADSTMRFLRALFNFAKYEYRGLENSYLFEHNPVQILSHQSLWNKVPRRHTRLTKGQLPEWFDALETIRQQGDLFARSVCDMVEMALLTGLRRSELLSLTWRQVNLKELTFYISTTKNGDPLELPISNHLYKLLKRRFHERDASPYVFNAPNEYGQVKEPRKVLMRISEMSGVVFTLHDLRRTFTTTAEAMNVGGYTIKRLLNHRTRRDDVTAGYMVLTPEELREPSQRIENELLTQAGIKTPVVAMDETLENILRGLSEVEKSELVSVLSKKLKKEQ